MIIIKQADNNPVLAYLPQERKVVVERKDLGACPLGTVGNLQFRAEQGGTPRASRVGVMLSDAWHALLKLSNDLMYCFTFKQADGQEEHIEFMAARSSSRRIGNLLGCLTAPADDVRADLRTAQELAELAEMSRGNLANLTGGRESLGFYLNELSDADLISLHNGVLGCPAARASVLNEVAQISFWAQDRAPQVLNQIAKALSRQFAKKVVQEPFTLISDLLSANPVDRKKLEEPLIRLAKGLQQFQDSRKLTALESDGDPLDSYLRLLPKKQLEALLTKKSISNLEKVQKERPLTEDASKNPAFIMLDRITTRLKSERDARVQPERQQEPVLAEESLDTAKDPRQSRLQDMETALSPAKESSGSPAVELNAWFQPGQVEAPAPAPAEKSRIVIKVPRQISVKIDQKRQAIEPLLEEIVRKWRIRVDVDTELFQNSPNQAEGPPASPLPINPLNKAALKRLGQAAFLFLQSNTHLNLVMEGAEHQPLDAESLSQAQEFAERMDESGAKMQRVLAVMGVA